MGLSEGRSMAGGWGKGKDVWGERDQNTLRYIFEDSLMKLTKHYRKME
jgi:hypothetical protein